MPIDVDGLIDSLRRGIAAIPPVVIAVLLLAGPTAALIGYRIMGYRMMAAARRMHALHAVEAAPLWVCHDCRSVNELRVSRCYRCRVDRDANEDLEVIFDLPTAAPAFFEVPAGSPFAAVSASTSRVPPASPSKPLLTIASVRRPAAAGMSHAPEPDSDSEPITLAPSPGIPVMADASSGREPIPVGPGEPIEVPAWPSQLARERVRVALPVSEPDDAASTNGTGSGLGPRT